MELIVKNLSKRFGEKLILDRLSLSIESGEFISLVGSSGSGKSTILRLIAGLEHPSSGSISVDGTPVSGPGPDRSMVFQKYSLYPWLNAAEHPERERHPRHDGTLKNLLRLLKGRWGVINAPYGELMP